MNARKTIVRMAAGLLVAALLPATACKKKNDVPEPQEPYVDPTLEGDPPPERTLKNLAGIIITSDPSFEVMVDGKSVGKTPLTVEHLPEGVHEVTFIDPEGGNATQTVELGEGEFKKAHYAASPNSSDARMK
jgi:hypothetical protein